ncbi:MAG: hypothetical protein H0W76_07255 [Pyrinomonadaceae bacterium]|nr:hypothetical protein [Pyrinomonadaceae bacterium]
MLKKMLCVAVLFLGATVTEAAPSDLIELALTEVGTGSVEEMRKRIFSIPITVLGADFRWEAIERLPASIRQQRITSGRLLSRAEKILQPVLQLHKRTECVELFLYRNDSPRAVLWMGCVLILSDSLVALLYDAELTGIVAHELAHLYFMDAMAAAQKTNDERRMKVIELKCDAVAMLPLKLLEGDPTYYIRGVKRMANLMRNDSFFGRPVHCPIAVRVEDAPEHRGTSAVLATLHQVVGEMNIALPKVTQVSGG